MDILAQQLEIDAVELRRINALDVGSVTCTGQLMKESVGLNECIEKVDRDMRSFNAVERSRLPAQPGAGKRDSLRWPFHASAAPFRWPVPSHLRYHEFSTRQCSRT
jgi:hypothetical protein